MARIFKPKVARRTTSESTPSLLSIEGFSHDGRGIARHQGKTVFVEGALPSETVEVVHYRRQKRFSECRTKRVVTASTERVTPPCEIAERCGGCQLQHLQASQQIEYKQQALLQMLQRQYQLQPSQVLAPIRSHSEGYRTRVRFGIDAQAQLSFRQKASDDLVAVPACPVIDQKLQRLLPELQAWLNQLPERSGVTHIEMIAAADAQGKPLSALVIRHVKALSIELRAALQACLKGTICWFQAQKGGVLTNAADEPVAPHLYLSLDDEAIQLTFAPGDFTQVNAAVNQKMVAQALEWLALDSSDCVADLFCGMGNFTLPIAKRVTKTLGVEGSDLMVERASQNAIANHLTEVEFKALDLTSTALGNLLAREKINKVLIDPPRSGAKFVCEQIAESDIKRLVYVSCNPASFARDASILAAAGFDMRTLRSMDMFPHTSHMEAMALFVRG